MCGIAGVFGLRPGTAIDRAVAERMSLAVAHRGPDGTGHWHSGDGRVSFAHRRLSIIDLETGAQPMADPATGVVIVFNGEIYNYIELRQELRAQGVCFHTQSDTEVLLRLYLEHGTAAVERLRGMYAFALWDPRAGQVFAARDRIGKKPFYYAVDGERFLFASTFHAVRAELSGPAETDPRCVHEFLVSGYVRAPRTIDPRVSKLPAGTLLTAGREGVQVARYWDIANRLAPFEGSYEEALDALDEILNTAVAIRLRSDVPLGVFLSGGVDSSLVAAVAARQSDRRILTFSVGFDDPRFDERVHAARIAEHIGSEHHAFQSHFNILDLLPDLVRHYGEPFGDPSALPIWLLAERTRRHVTVAVGGDGGDEGFAGYDWYRTAERVRGLGRWLPRSVWRAGASAAGATGAAFGRAGRLARSLSLLSYDHHARFSHLRAFIDPLLARRLYAGDLKAFTSTTPGGGAETDPDEFPDASDGDPMTWMRVADIRTYLADCLMPKVDVATMAHGLEARAPLLDHELLGFALSLPPAWLTDRRSGKLILKALARRYLPPDTLDRPKQGFDVPLITWFARELRPRMTELPRSQVLRETGWFQLDALGRLVAEHMRGGRDHAQRLYNLLILEEWLRQS